MTENDFCPKNSSGNSLKPLFKHMHLAYALDLLQNNRLWFANPVEWEDPFESRFLIANLQDSKTSKVDVFPWSNKVFCACFTNCAASEAHWKRSGEDSIMLHFNRQILLDNLRKLPDNMQVYIGRVEYKETRDITKADLTKIPFNKPVPNKGNINDYCARLLLLKRNAFRYEEEIRVMIVINVNNGKKKGEYFLQWDAMEKMISTITLFPFKNEDSNLKLAQFLSSNFAVKVVKSRLYRKHKPKNPLTW